VPADPVLLLAGTGLTVVAVKHFSTASWAWNVDISIQSLENEHQMIKFVPSANGLYPMQFRLAA